MSVYFIASHSVRVVKIGYSADPQNRLRQLQTSHYNGLEVAVVWPEGTRLDEKDLHRRFRENRIRGEWFHLSKPIRDLMLAIAEEYPDANPRPEPPPQPLERPRKFTIRLNDEELALVKEAAGDTSVTRYMHYAALRDAELKVSKMPPADAFWWER